MKVFLGPGASGGVASLEPYLAGLAERVRNSLRLLMERVAPHFK